MREKQKYSWDRKTLGTDYYPEHWPEELWEEDLRRMKDAGITCIRIAEFSWNFVEPEEGVFTFDFYDRFLELCERAGMQVIFGTPSATPPAWLTEKYPEVLNAKPDGTLLRHGGRRHYNYNSPKYRELVSRIVAKEAEHYGPHPAIVGWQIDNELNCETADFYSEADSAAFRVFLKNRYGSLPELNRAWGTVFWNQTYTDWSEVYVPRTILNEGVNPHQHLDYLRFVSESAISFASMQAEIIRKYRKPGDYITTNGLFGHLDNHRLQDEVLDVYTYDSYPNFARSVAGGYSYEKDMLDRGWSRNLTEVRSVCPHFGVMEQQSGPGGWTTRMEQSAPLPGQLKLWAMQSVAHGADYVGFFRWRTACFGTEIYWHGILNYDNRDNRRLAEVKTFAKELQSIGETVGAEYRAAFAVLSDYDNVFDAGLDRWHGRVAEPSEQAIFRASQKYHTAYDLLNFSDETELCELKKYPALFYPHPVIMTERRAAVLSEYVKQGGALVIGCRGGYKDIEGQCVMSPMPGPLAPLTGTTVNDFTFACPGEEDIFASDHAGQKLFDMPVFTEVLETADDVSVLARFGNAWFEGSPALTERLNGSGRTLHLAGTFTDESCRFIFEHLGILEPLKEYVTAPAEVELAMQEKDGEKYIFVLNYMHHEMKICLKHSAVNLLTGEALEGEVTLPAFGTAVYRF